MSKFRGTKGRGSLASRGTPLTSKDWLVKDDVSGLVIYASKSAFDLKGRLVDRSSMDQADSDDYPAPTPRPDYPPPFVRPDGDLRYNPTAPTESQTLAERFAAGNYNFDT